MSKKSDFNFNIKTSRRNFFGRSAMGALGAAGIAKTINQMAMMNAMANQYVIGNDYKAVVCCFLAGGCDMNNLLVPTQTNPQKTNYVADRGIAKVPENVAEQGDPAQWTIDGAVGGTAAVPNTYLGSPASIGQPMGLHPSCKNLHTMYQSGEAAFIANCGNLSVPVTQAEYLAASVQLPVQLFSHSDQVTEWMAGSAPEKPFTSGWAGRVANLIDSTENFPDSTSMLLTVAGNNDFMVSPGGAIPRSSVTTAGAIRIVGYGPTTNPYQNALDGSNKYVITGGQQNTGKRLRAFEDIMLYNHPHIIEQGYNSVVKRARENEALIGEALNFTDPAQGSYIGVDLDTIFHAAEPGFGVAANSNVGLELKMIARLIAGRSCLGNRRQIFFCNQGGYDNHQDINNDQPALLEDLDRSLGAFNEAMRQIALADADLSYNDILTFQASDFNRTWTPNGNDFATSGTDHAWGTHTFAFGGPIVGGDVYGTFPTLAKGSPDDVSDNTNTSRGRWIPTTAVDQYSAEIAQWFGVAPGNLNDIFTNRPNFETNPALSNLEFIDFTRV